MSDRPWQVLDRKVVYESDWVGVQHWAVRLPDGSVIPDHHVVVYPYQVVGIVPRGEDGSILLVDHYRFITDTRGWEIPGGKIEKGESLETAAMRELLEETGYSAESVSPLGFYYPSNGSGDQLFHTVIARGVHHVSEIPDQNESISVRWFAPDEVRTMLKRNEIKDGLSITALWWALS